MKNITIKLYFTILLLVGSIAAFANENGFNGRKHYGSLGPLFWGTVATGLILGTIIVLCSTNSNR